MVLKEPSQTISPNAIKLWRLTSSITHGILFLILGILLVFSFYFQWAEWWNKIFYGLGLLLIFSCIVELFIEPIYKQKTWRYGIDEKSIQLKYGGIIQKTYKVIPMNKVYYVHTYQNPFLKKYKLASVKIGTVAYIHEIPALPEEEAKRVCELVVTLSESKNNNKQGEEEISGV
ncbi:MULTISPECIES: PH domain-containing protein [Aeribacillus]|uniref:PH domain-containing protein n=1 Tax=Aeribacillus TaxID=1055323 RepID=UPI002871E2D3|nr:MULTISPECIES: PH domain-containing protein [Aeribacillus]MDR9796118.1 PH domain-containing protein [Aeribacillus pallidus]